MGISSVHVSIERLFEGRSSPEYQAFHRREGDFEDFSDFLVGKLFVVPEDYGHALSLWKG